MIWGVSLRKATVNGLNDSHLGHVLLGLALEHTHWVPGVKRSELRATLPLSTSSTKYFYKIILPFQALYGQRTHHPPDLCSDPTFDAIFQYPAGVIYILKGKGEAS
jgi:hypothetical protein